jgi:arginase
MTLLAIEVPYMNGDPRHAACKGPARLASEAGLRSAAVDVDVDGAAALEAAFAVNRALAARVREAVAHGDTPLVLPGCCDAAMGVLAGVEHARCGVVWIDAHGDFNTPETSPSGFLPGMALAAIVGHCHAEAWATMGDATPVAEEATLLLGTRDLDPAERIRLERSPARTIEWRGGRPLGDPLQAIESLAARVDDVYLHIDLDGLDPELVPSVIPYRSPGGLSLAQATGVIAAVRARLRLVAATVSYYSPELDVDERTLRTALALIAAIAG